MIIHRLKRTASPVLAVVALAIARLLARKAPR
jgi:hypothetical protein